MKSLTIVSYAINGRGMGHLVRQIAILRWVRRICALLEIKLEAWILTTSEADTLARREGFVALKIPSKAMLRDAGMEPSAQLATLRAWVLQTVAMLRPDILLVDTFPGGSFGELVTVLELAKSRVLVKRRVRPEFAENDAYHTLLPLYDSVITPDDTGSGPILLRERPELLSRDEARAALGIPGDGRGVYVTLGCGADASAPSLLPQLVKGVRARGWHAVVAAGPLYMGPELRGDGITWMTRYAPVELMQGLDAALSAGGYNTFHELMFAGVPTVFLPQPRIADDQAGRVQRAVAAGAGRHARNAAEALEMLAEPGASEAARALVPRNGARDAARQVLASVLDAADLDWALGLLTDDLIALSRRLDGTEQDAYTLVRQLADSPSEHARKAALLNEHGVDLPAPVGLQRFLDAVTAAGVPPKTAQLLLKGLGRKFPAATAADLVAACERLFPVWARFDDWMGAVALLRAVPTQRGLALKTFVDALVPWLEQQDELFDAVRDFSRLEMGGERPIAEVLTLLEAPR
ncbi:MAG: hypothetical protein H6737_28675 [Alphaproteobacteria bacterium]|nr:hypothetical protein [Alphaproteobacteria bacterium]